MITSLARSDTRTLGVYGRVIDELEDAPRQDAEAAIAAAREARPRSCP